VEERKNLTNTMEVLCSLIALVFTLFFLWVVFYDPTAVAKERHDFTDEIFEKYACHPRLLVPLQNRLVVAKEKQEFWIMPKGITVAEIVWVFYCNVDLAHIPHFVSGAVLKNHRCVAKFTGVVKENCKKDGSACEKLSPLCGKITNPFNPNDTKQFQKEVENMTATKKNEKLKTMPESVFKVDL
jgi:hypothetical protein